MRTVIRGVGIDVVEVARIEHAMKNPRFVARILSKAEFRENMSASFVAGRWAAKEAIAKAVSARLRWHDVEIHNDMDGRPVARIVPKTDAENGIVVAPSLVEFAEEISSQIHISISHEKGLASAVAVWEQE